MKRQKLKAIRLMNFKGVRGIEDADGELQPLEIELRPITLLFGPNSAGKSTILQSLAYLREILDRRNLNPDQTLVGGQYMDLGGFRNLMYRHDLNETMKIGFVVEAGDFGFPDYLTQTEEHEIGSHLGVLPEEVLGRAEAVRVDLSLRWSDLAGGPFVSYVECIVAGAKMLSIESSEDGRDVRLDYLNLRHPVFVNEPATNDEDDHFTSFSDIAGEALHSENLKYEPAVREDPNELESALAIPPSWTDRIAFDLPLANQADALPRLDERLTLGQVVWNEEADWDNPLMPQVYVASVLSGLVTGSLDSVSNELARSLYLGPIREVPDRDLTESKSPDASGWTRGASAWNAMLQDEGGLVEAVNFWIADKERLNTGYRVEVTHYRELPVNHPVTHAINSGDILDVEDIKSRLQELAIKSKALLREEETDLEVYPHDVGVGISQVLPVVVAALHSQEGIVAIEQPELHIHPALQVELGDLFASRLGAFSGVYLLETHSEHLILRLLRRIRETTDDELLPGAPELTPDDVAVHYIEAGDNGTSIRRLRIDDSGDFVDRWPSGFFEERAGELF